MNDAPQWVVPLIFLGQLALLQLIDCVRKGLSRPVANISNITVGLDGNPLPGPVLLLGDTTIVSFDASQWFFDFGPAAGADFFLRYGNGQISAPLANAQFQELSGSFTHLFPYDIPIQSASWSLTDVSGESVPDGGTTAAMVGMAIVGLVALRRRSYSRSFR